MNIRIFFLLFLCASTTTRAEIFTPHSPDSVIATWPAATLAPIRAAKTAVRLQPDDLQALINLVNIYLEQAALPGQSRRYGLAQAALAPWINQQGNSIHDAKNQLANYHAELWLAWAQVQQHQHQFDVALDALKQVFQAEPNHIAGSLLAARIYLIQDNTAAARRACLNLLGHTDLLTASTCLLEVSSFQGELQESYQQLSGMVEREGLAADKRAPWIAQVLADMALRLENPRAAAQWLRPAANQTSVNYWAQWADIQLELEQPQHVLLALEPVVQVAADIDDALLLRLALAEKREAEKKYNTNNNKWQEKMHARVNLREQRMDTQHASELARFYLDILPHPERALYWATINWQDAQEYSDKKLLQRATAQQQKETN